MTAYVNIERVNEQCGMARAMRSKRTQIHYIHKLDTDGFFLSVEDFEPHQEPKTHS